ncbi:restriction endonuclease subunit S [Methylophaga sp.]|uniref:restriction endonuclease subunit S n=1 Tax=Methylophaga sp. TaxID=2024840 RepID=UPI003A9279A1
MSELSFMEKLLDGVEVEWVELSELVDFLKGKSLPKERIVEDGENKCIHYGELFTHYPAVISEVKSRTNQSLDDSVLSMANDVLMPTSDVTPNGLATASCLSEAGVILGGDILVIRGGVIDGKYLSHFIKKSKSKIMQMVKGSTVYHIYAKDLGKLLIPIPCPENPEKSLEIQAEIVRILDSFTELTAELTAELSLRKKQYNYYRDKLLSFEEVELEWKQLGEIGQVRMCKRILKSQTLPEGEIPFYKIGTFGKAPDAFISRSLFEEYSSKYNYPKLGEVLISASGTIGRTVIFDGEDSYFQDSNIVWIENDERLVLNKFLFYFYQIANWGISEGGTIKRLYNDNLRKLSIPIPYPNNPLRSLEEQARIVGILDKFDALTNSITEGLPREIELRQKQYEYYRDLLLSFPRPDTKEVA